MNKDKQGYWRLDPEKYKLVYSRFFKYLDRRISNNKARKWYNDQNPRIQEASYWELDEALKELGNINIRHVLQDGIVAPRPHHSKKETPLETLAILLNFCSVPSPENDQELAYRPKKKKRENKPTGDSTPENSSSSVWQYGNNWRKAFNIAMNNSRQWFDSTIPETHLLPFLKHLKKHRFDRYIWPEVQYRFGSPTMASTGEYSDNSGWSTVELENDVQNTVMNHLTKKKLVLLHDDAGMGKTAFSWMLFNHILQNTEESTPFVIRLEGFWPRTTDDKKTPLSLEAVLIEELLGARILGWPVDSQVSNDIHASDVAQQLLTILRSKDVYVLLDGLDQMTEDDREVAINTIGNSVNFEDKIPKCHWLISGRPFSFRGNRRTGKLFNASVLRLRLKKFDENRQNKYFEDLSDHVYFDGQLDGKKEPLSFMCSNWKKEATESDLGIPLHLLEIRNVIEDFLTPYASAQHGRRLTEIRSSSELHARISDVYLRRTISQFDERDSIEAKDVPPTDAAKIDVLRHICGCLAIQMMLDQNYNASIDNTTTKLQSYANTSRTDLVDAYLERCRNRYEYSKNSRVSYWAWGVNILQTSEVTHRNDIDVFTHECRSFRDRKAMEWYAAHYLMNHSNANDWNEIIPNSGDQKIISFLGNTNWTRCWQLAMELPNNFYVEKKLKDCINHVFCLPRDPSKRRPCEWMWIAWCKRLEQDELAIQRMIIPLASAKDVIKVFRQEFNTLIKQGNAIADELKFNDHRDSPNLSLTNPNQTEKGQYRRIPDKGESSVFFGERTTLVSVSQFWLRKFMVTNEEYRLFDPSHNPKFNRDDLPVTEVDWYMATMFCCWLGPDYRLPTEAEWETACRANKTKDCKLQDETKYWFGNDVTQAKNHTWYRRNSNGSMKCLSDSSKTSLHQNRWGLFDIAGNVWEWTSDWYAVYSTESNLNPTGPKDGVRRVLRGGSWQYKFAGLSSDFRARYEPLTCNNSTGFRIAMSSSESSRSERETGKKVK